MIVAAIVIINPDITTIPSKLFISREAITLEESMLGELSPNDFSYQWLQLPQSQDSDNTIPTLDELIFEDSKNLNLLTMPSIDKSLNKSFEFQSNDSFINSKFKPKLTTLISNTSLISSIEIQGYKISPNKRYLLIWVARKKLFRYTSTAKYFLYDMKRDLISILSTNQQMMTDPKQQQQQANSYENLDSASQFLNYQDEGNQFTRFQVVNWIQNNNLNQESLLLIQNNDIYLLNLPNTNDQELNDSNNNNNNNNDSNQEIISPVRLTFTGKLNEIFNGVPDWLYEEEILSDTPAYQVSQKANTLAYMSFNDSLVDIMSFTVFGSSEQIIPKAQEIRYPKAGRVNPTVSIHIIDNLYSNDNDERFDIKLKLPNDLSSKQHYINRIKWLNDDKLAFIWLDRNQNESYIIVCSRNNNWKCEKNLHLKANNGWLDMSDDLYPLNDDYYLAIILKHESDDVGAFKHVAKVSLKQPNSFVYLTSGRKEVLNINGIDKRRSIVYYTSTVENEPGQRQMFWANLGPIDDSQQQQQQQQPLLMVNDNDIVNNDRCITCSHYPEECLFNHVKMSPSTRKYIFECLGPGVPRIELRAVPSLTSNINRNNNPKLKSLRPPFSAKSLDLNSNFDLDTSTKDSSNNVPTTLTSTKLEPTTFSNKRVPDNDTNNKNVDDIQVDNTLLWTIETNQALRDKLTINKAMPLTMRLKVPIANTSYFANVLMLLPPQLGPINTFRAFKSPSSSANSNSNLRTFRSAISSSSSSDNIEQALHSYFTPDSISEYTNKLTSSQQQYPMVVDVYAGPGSQRVDYRFHINFGHYLASSRRTIYVMIDGRGSGYEGTKRLYELYHKFGTVEIDDQIEVAAYLTRNYSFIDPNKVAIWGWSYGGYAAAMALAKSNAKASIRTYQDKLNYSNKLRSSLSTATTNDSSSSSSYSSPSILSQEQQHQINDIQNKQITSYSPTKGVFECAISVAPVTNWLYYDTAYTERFMSSPYLNEQYDNFQPNDHLNIFDNIFESANSNQHSINLHGHLQPIEDSHQLQQQQRQIKEKQNNIDINRLISNKWNHLNQTIESHLTHPSLIDLMIRSSSSSSSLASAPSTTQKVTSINRDRINLSDLNDRYKAASLLDQIGNIDKKRFLLIHGTADDNVHFQQSIMLMKRLIQKNIMYETRLYPDQDHSISNRADKIHLGSTLSNFFSECFDMAY